MSAIVAEMLGCAYWKPIQAGQPRDTETVRALVSNKKCKFLNEQYLLKTPASPHFSAKVDEVEISVDKFELPTTDQCIIEGAGGLLVPINDDEVIADLIPYFRSEVILVANLYLGSINHTLLSVEELERRKASIKGIIFNGESNPASEEIILRKSGYRCLMKLPTLDKVDKQSVKFWAEKLSKNW